MADDNTGFEDGPIRTRRRGNGDGPDSGGAGGSIDPATLGTGSEPGADPRGIGDDGDDGYIRDANGTVKRNKDGSPRKKRGKRSAGSSSNTGDLKSTIEALAILTQFGQGMFALVVNAPEMELNREESVAMAGAVAPVLDMLDINPDPRIAKIAVALGTVAAIQAPHIAMWRMRLANERAEKAKPVKGTDRPATPAPDLGAGFGAYGGPEGNAVN